MIGYPWMYPIKSSTLSRSFYLLLDDWKPFGYMNVNNLPLEQEKMQSQTRNVTKERCRNFKFTKVKRRYQEIKRAYRSN